MMTDFEKVYSMLKSIGVPLQIVDSEPAFGKEIYIEPVNALHDDNIKVRGYAGLYTYYSFNSDGSFSHIGIYE